MPTTRVISSATIQLQQKLCAAALAAKGGIIWEFPSRDSAIRGRMAVYTARRELRKISPEDSSPLSIVEMRLKKLDDGKWGLHIAEPGNEMFSAPMYEAASGKTVKLKDWENRDPEMYSLTEDELTQIVWQKAANIKAGMSPATADRKAEMDVRAGKRIPMPDWHIGVSV